jgi:hypothetical protein
MATTPQPHPPSPELIFETLNAYQRTAALRGAIELDLFTAIGEGAVTAPDLAGKLKVSERGARILCDYLVVTGLLTKQGARYGLTPDSALFRVSLVGCYLALEHIVAYALLRAASRLDSPET